MMMSVFSETDDSPAAAIAADRAARNRQVQPAPAPEWAPPPSPPAPVPIKALGITVADLDQERAGQRKALDKAVAERADVAARLGDYDAPKSGGLAWLAKRLKTSRTPAERRADADRLAELDHVIAETTDDLARLDGLRGALVAESAAAAFDKEDRPRLRKGAQDLAAALLQARAALRAANLDAAQLAAGQNFVASFQAGRRGVSISEIVAPEIALLAAWRSLLDADRPNPSKLATWLNELKQAGIVIKEGK